MNITNDMDLTLSGRQLDGISTLLCSSFGVVRCIRLVATRGLSKTNRTWTTKCNEASLKALTSCKLNHTHEGCIGLILYCFIISWYREFRSLGGYLSDSFSAQCFPICILTQCLFCGTGFGRFPTDPLGVYTIRCG